MSETALVRELLVRLCAVPGCVAWRAQSIVAFDRNGRKVTALPEGHADIAGVWNGRAIFVEAKAATRQRRGQRRFQAAVEARGALYLLVHSVAELDRLLEGASANASTPATTAG
jgi:hypothetical protein